MLLWLAAKHQYLLRLSALLSLQLLFIPLNLNVAQESIRTIQVQTSLYAQTPNPTSAASIATQNPLEPHPKARQRHVQFLATQENMGADS
jgi:hypothetical protein